MVNNGLKQLDLQLSWKLATSLINSPEWNLHTSMWLFSIVFANRCQSQPWSAMLFSCLTPTRTWSEMPRCTPSNQWNPRSQLSRSRPIPLADCQCLRQESSMNIKQNQSHNEYPWFLSQPSQTRRWHPPYCENWRSVTFATESKDSAEAGHVCMWTAKQVWWHGHLQLDLSSVNGLKNYTSTINASTLF